MTITVRVDDVTFWRAAACRGDPRPESWFPFPSDDFAYAREVCGRCPIRVHCTTFAMDTRQSGVWGGVEFDRGRPSRS